MSDSQTQNNPITTNEEQNIKYLKLNTLLFEQKIQKLKKKVKEIQQKEKENKKNKTKPLNKNSEKKSSINEKSKTLEIDKQYSKKNIKNDININNNDTNSEKKINYKKNLYNTF